MSVITLIADFFDILSNKIFYHKMRASGSFQNINFC